MDTPHRTAEDVVRACFTAFASKDREAMEALLADDFHFTSPLDNRIDREGYFEICWPNNTRVDGFEIVWLTVDGDQVVVIYEGHGKDGRFRNTEIHTVRGGKNVEIEVYFGWNLPHPAKPGTHKG